MSQKVKIQKVSVLGAAPFLGLADNDDPDSQRLFSRDPEQVMGWLCAAWRTRYNAFRSRRCTYNAEGELVPIGKGVDERTLAQARVEQSWISAVPDLVACSPEKLEKQDWFAASRRKKTLKAKGAYGGKMPRFRSAVRDDQVFTCWFNGGRNARFTQVNRNHGIVSITGQNPAGFHQGTGSRRFTIRLHVRTSQPIRDYSSVRINWSRRELVFINDPLPIQRARTNSAVGLDRGATVQLATSDRLALSLPAHRLKAIDAEVRRRQRAQARAVKASGHTTQRQYRAAGASQRFTEHENQIRRLKARAVRIITEHQHQFSTALVKDHDAIFTEHLHLAQMGRRAKPVPDPTRPGHHLPNGQARKRGLNRVMAGAALGRVQEMLVYKAARAGVELHEVPAQNTSRRCPECGHTAAENRKSQAIFCCTQCGHTDNADINAARNILQAGLKAHPGIARSITNRSGRDLASEGSQTARWGVPHPLPSQ